MSMRRDYVICDLEKGPDPLVLDVGVNGLAVAEMPSRASISFSVPNTSSGRS